VTIGQFSIGEAAIDQQGASKRGGKPPRSRQAVAKPDSTALIPEAR